MKHLNTGEYKLFNVRTDYREQHDLTTSMPARVREMEAIRSFYVESVDGGSIEQARAAHARLMDKFAEQSKEGYRKKLADLKKNGGSDYEAKKAALLKDVNQKIRKNALNKKETALFASSTSFREGKSDAKKEAQAYLDAHWVDWNGEGE